MIDTHTHPYLPEFENDGVDAVDRAVAAGVSMMVLPNVDESSIQQMMKLHSLRPESTVMAMGLHPTEVASDWPEVVDRMETLLGKGGFVAVGEIGMDLYWDATRREMQREAFARQLRIAERLHLPVIIHCREALDDTLDIIKEVGPTVPLVFHSFTGSREDVRKIRAVCTPMFGINGVVTFKNAASLRDALPEIGIENILLETDAPYLAPVPHRGKRNESAYIVNTLNAVASVIGLSPEDVERITDSNARKIFNI